MLQQKVLNHLDKEFRQSCKLAKPNSSDTIHMTTLIKNPLAFSTMPSPSSRFLLLLLLLLLLITPPILAATSIINTTTCRDTCGTIPINFPFGTASGCGHPSFTRYIKCTTNPNGFTLQFITGTGIYTVSSIDYATNTLTVSDPLMSTCTSMQNSGSFTLDKASPFTIRNENIFVLLGCSTTSPLFDSNEDLCDTGSGSRVCRGLYSCEGVRGIGLEPNAPISTCCVYDGGTLGLGFGLDLPKMQCSSYTSVYEFGDEGDPMKWKFGISLGYNDSYYTKRCKDCEASGGLCGYGGLDQAFACVCRSGMNTTTNCFGQG